MNVIIDSNAAYGLRLFGMALALGFGLGAVNTVFGVLRQALALGKVLTAVTDFFFWLLCGLAVFSYTLSANTGIIRGYILVGCGIGAAINAAVIALPLGRALNKCLSRRKKPEKSVKIGKK